LVHWWVLVHSGPLKLYSLMGPIQSFSLGSSTNLKRKNWLESIIWNTNRMACFCYDPMGCLEDRWYLKYNTKKSSMVKKIRIIFGSKLDNTIQFVAKSIWIDNFSILMYSKHENFLRRLMGFGRM
jgi:hypothetical protein